MPSERPHISALGEGGLFQFRGHIEIVLLHIGVILEQVGQFLFVKTREGQVKSLRLQRFDFHAQKLLVPSGVHCHSIVGEDVRFFLRFCQMVGKDARNLCDAFFLRRKNTTVAGDNAKVTVDDHGIDEAELSQRGAQLIYLFRGVGTRVIDIRHQLCNRNELHFSRCLHIASPPPSILCIYRSAPKWGSRCQNARKWNTPQKSSF